MARRVPVPPARGHRPGEPGHPGRRRALGVLRAARAIGVPLTDIAFARAGSGPPVLLIQGVAMEGRAWSPQVDALADRFELAWYDNRGVGGSPGPVGTVADMARDAESVLDALGWRAAHVMGHSLGGVIAQQLALTAPDSANGGIISPQRSGLRRRHLTSLLVRQSAEDARENGRSNRETGGLPGIRVRSLSLLCTFARGNAALSLAPSAIWGNLRTLLGTRAMRRRAFFELVSDASVAPDEPAMAVLEGVFGRSLVDGPAAAGPQVLALSRADLRGRLPAIRCPVLVLGASHDRIAPPAQSEELASILGVQAVILRGGHAVPVQDAPAVNASLAAFLAGLPAP